MRKKVRKAMICTYKKRSHQKQKKTKKRDEQRIAYLVKGNK
jgi:hypothetical protein